jgi:hypothetical protein
MDECSHDDSLPNVGCFVLQEAFPARVSRERGFSPAEGPRSGQTARNRAGPEAAS